MLTQYAPQVTRPATGDARARSPVGGHSAPDTTTGVALVPVGANRQPAWGEHVRDPGTGSCT